MSETDVPNYQTHKVLVKAGDAGMRLDALVVKCVPGLTRSQVKRLIEGDLVRVDGARAKVAQKVAKGCVVLIEVPPPEVPSAHPEEIPLEILYEDEDIIVVNKPAGMVVHPAAGHPHGTLVNALLAHCGALSTIGEELKPGIVHRLDVGTSGVMVAAKNDSAHRSLARQFKDRTVKKIYSALAMGVMRNDTGSFEAPLGRSKGYRKRISSHTGKGKVARTEWKVAERFGSHASLLEVSLHTGRTHQIRVHLAESGHPLVGDPLYGGRRKAKHLPEGPLRDAATGFSRPALHAWRLGFDHPRTGERMEFVAELPADIRKLLEAFRKNAQI